MVDYNSHDGYDYRATDCPHWYEGLCVLLSIENGVVSWRIVNTRNVDNLGIEIDHDEARTKHNEQICRYLCDDGEYWIYFRKVIKSKGYNKLLKTSTKFVVNHWKRKLLGNKRVPVNNKVWERMFRPDANREYILWSLKQHDR